MDNVLVGVTGPAVRRFEIEARHPVYAPLVADPISAADFTNCDFPPEPIWDFDRQTHLLWQDDRLKLVGHRLAKSWRPELVDVSVGDRTWPGLHLLQLSVLRPEGDVEVLVLYPSDGYWRAKPLPPAGQLDSPFGASFLIGPVEVDRRPLVRLSSVRFDPAGPAFEIAFVRGGSARLAIRSIGADMLRLEAVLSDPVPDLPFAMLSSMFVAQDNADIGVLRVRPAGAPFWETLPPVGFAPVEAGEAVFARDIPSRHNTLAPDIAFGPFLSR
jgi:hypothetical protein